MNCGLGDGGVGAGVVVVVDDDDGGGMVVDGWEVAGGGASGSAASSGPLVEERGRVALTADRVRLWPLPSSGCV